VRPRIDKALGQWIGWVGVTHVRRHHKHHHSRGGGHLYQGQFKSFPVAEDEYFLTLCRYVEANALRAKLVERKKTAPSGKRPPGACGAWRTLDLAIPCRVASQQSPTPLHQANLILGQGGLARSPRKNKRTKQVVGRRLHRPFFSTKKRPSWAQGQSECPRGPGPRCRA
jgi:hypothetical protein